MVGNNLHSAGNSLNIGLGGLEQGACTNRSESLVGINKVFLQPMFFVNDFDTYHTQHWRHHQVLMSRKKKMKMML